MTDLVTSAQMRAIEGAAIESGAMGGLDLMERAGAGVVAAVLARWPRLAGRAMVLCGPGNNGGDGFVIARLLAEHGWSVAAFLHGDPARLPPDARTNHDRWAAIGPVRALDAAPGDLGADTPDLIVDALFGTGLTRVLPVAVAQALAEIGAWRLKQQTRPPLVAVDVPSGLCADSGRLRGAVLCCDLTVTFHAAKPGHYLAEGPGVCGALVVADIGLPAQPGVAAPEVVHLVTGAVRPWLAKHGGHKYHHGHALVMTGGMGRTGAARLAARAALRIGAGLVTLGAPGGAMLECAGQITALMLRRIDAPEDLAAMLEDARINALALGPGMGVERARALLPVALASGRALVLDADALTALAGDLSALHPRCVLTPHAGEFARLFPDLAADGAASRLDIARAAAARAGCVVLLKGPDTVIAAPDGRAAIHAAAYARATPWLATAGAGDVLAGLIAGLLARGVPAFEAAQAAAWLHVEAALAFGPGLIAEDLPDVVPVVLRRLFA